MSASGEPSVAAIERAARAIESRIVRTPVRESASLGELAGVPVYLKLEHRQTSGSFKLRGASNALSALDAERRRRGVVGVSTGNHGRGLAHAAKVAGVRCVICLSSLVPRNKIDGIRACGAEVRIVGRSQDEAQVEVERLVAEQGMTMIPPFDHPDVIAGQGTLGLELIEQLPELDHVLVPLSGGGLLAGVALALKARRPGIRVTGVSMRRGAAMHAALRAGHPVPTEELPTLADSLGGGLGEPNRHTFRLVRELADEVVLVDERDIARAIRQAYLEEREIIEGSGAVGIAAIACGACEARGNTCVLLTGGNIDPQLHRRIVSGEDVDVTADPAAARRPDSPPKPEVDRTS